MRGGDSCHQQEPPRRWTRCRAAHARWTPRRTPPRGRTGPGNGGSRMPPGWGWAPVTLVAGSEAEREGNGGPGDDDRPAIGGGELHDGDAPPGCRPTDRMFEAKHGSTTENGGIWRNGGMCGCVCVCSLGPGKASDLCLISYILAQKCSSWIQPCSEPNPNVWPLRYTTLPQTLTTSGRCE